MMIPRQTGLGHLVGDASDMHIVVLDIPHRVIRVHRQLSPSRPSLPLYQPRVGGTRIIQFWPLVVSPPHDLLPVVGLISRSHGAELDVLSAVSGGLRVSG